MYVKIGPYKNWYGPYQIANLLQKVRVSEDRCDKIGDWLAGTKFNDLLTWIDSKRKRTVKVRIDSYDTYSMDHTLAYIVLPMLKQLKEQKHGSPYVDQEDLPAELRLSDWEMKVFQDRDWDKSIAVTEDQAEAIDNKFHSQWDWVLDQIIWSFEQELDDNDGADAYYEPYDENETVEPMMATVIDDNGNETEEEFISTERRRKMGRLNKEKFDEYHKRKQLGFTFFGKYYQSLWS